MLRVPGRWRWLLAGVLAFFTTAYGYDGVGNRQWLNSLSTYFDANGNTVSLEGTWAYDWANRLINYNSGAVVLTYDAEGHRTKKVAGTTTHYLVATVNPTGWPQVVEEHTGASPGTVSRRYTHGLDLISQWQSPGNATHFHLSDGLGSVRALLNTAGGLTDTYTYDAYGNLIASSTPTDNAYRFTGEQWDADLGQYYLRARYLHPGYGRFWTRDSFEGNQSDPLSLHAYLYAHDNPVNNVDPSGHMTVSDLGAALTKVGYLAGNLGIRALPTVNRVTIALYEGVSGSTVVGGAGLLAGGKIAVTVVGGATKFIDPIAKAHTERVALAGFAEAGKYGVWPFKVLQRLVPKFSGLQKHHLVEERFATALGVKADDIPAIALTQAEHADFTAAWRRLIAYEGSVSNPLTTTRATPEAIWKAAQEVYQGHPELLDFVKTFLNIP